MSVEMDSRDDFPFQLVRHNEFDAGVNVGVEVGARGVCSTHLRLHDARHAFDAVERVQNVIDHKRLDAGFDFFHWDFSKTVAAWLCRW